MTAANAADGLYRARPIGARRLPDIFGYDIVEALGRSGCPLCRVEAIEDRRWMDSFWREGRKDPRMRRRFFDAGGFCRHHAWLLHRSVAAKDKGAAIADVYGWLAESDLAWLHDLRGGLGRGRRLRRRLERTEACPACVALEEAGERNVHFFIEALSEAHVRARYASSDGLCFTHLTAAVNRALHANEDLARFLLDDWRARLAELRIELAELERKRDYRYALESKGDEEHSWTEVIRRYVGEEFTDPGCGMVPN